MLFSGSSETEATPATTRPTCLEPAVRQGSGRELPAISSSLAPPVCRGLVTHTPTAAPHQHYALLSSVRKPLLVASCIQCTVDVHTGTLRSIGSRPCPRACQHVCPKYVSLSVFYLKYVHVFYLCILQIQGNLVYARHQKCGLNTKCYLD